MILQSQLNQNTINFTKKIKALINMSADFEANQMSCYTRQVLFNVSSSINEMTTLQGKRFENDLIETFKNKNWINDDDINEVEFIYHKQSI